MKTGKKVLSLMLSLMLVLGAVSVGGISASADDDGIVWNAAENRYEISNYAGLKEFASIVNGEHASIAQNTAACAVLTQDITADGTDWTPIGPNYSGAYTGTFDGDGHVITGLSYNNTSKSFSGLFGYVGSGGKVQNVGFEGGNITGKDYVGAIAGWNEGTITNCCNTCDISGADYVGGVVGINEGTIKNCYNTGSVTSTGQYATAGGVAGRSSGTVTNCYNTGDATANGTHANATYYGGGVVGNNTGTVTNCYNTGDTTVNGTDGSYTYGGGVAGRNTNSITNCYSTGKVTATRGNVRAGGAVGSNQGTVTDCYYDKSVCNVDNSIGTALTTDQMTGSNAADNMKGLFNDDGSSDNWYVTDSYPRLIYKIEDYAQLKAFAYRVNNGDTGLCAKLMNDIDASASASANDWTPIGSNYYGAYTGTFDGDGHVITGLTTPEDFEGYAGLFGCVQGVKDGDEIVGGIVKNVGLEGGSITGDDFTGGVVGWIKEGAVQNCYNTGSVNGTAENTFVGGIAGSNEGTIQNCYFTGTASSSYLAGGIAGFNGNGSRIQRCYNTGSVTGADKAGGLTGSNYGTVQDCYNKGGVTSTDDNSYAGGVTGENAGQLINCYNTGIIEDGHYKGGIAGINIEGTIQNCFYDSSLLNGIPASDYPVSYDGALTTAQMTGDDALSDSNMKFLFESGETNPWLTKTDGADEDSGKYYWFYPHLKGFAYDSETTAENWPAKTEVSVIDDSCIYDGKAHGVYVTVGDTSVPEGETVTYSKYSGGAWGTESDIAPTDPGKYKMEIRSGEDTVIKYFTILAPDTDYTVSYYKKIDSAWSTDPVDPVNAGDYKAVVSFTDSGHEPIEKEFTIVSKAVTVTVAGNDGPYMAYNGQEQTYTGDVVWIYDREETGLDDAKLRYTGNTTLKGTNAGEYSVNVSADYCVCDDSNYDVTFTGQGTIHFSISQSVLNIMAENKETGYGEDLAALTYTIEPRFGSYYNEEELDISLSTDADKNNAGAYDITVNVQDNPNYLINTQGGTYTVRQIDPGATVTAEDIDYGQKAVVTFTVPADAKGKVTFTLDEAETGVTNDIENGQAVCEFENLEIGSHKVECVYTGDGNYESGETKTASFEVKSIDCALTIKYLYDDGTQAAEPYTDSVAIFKDYSITSPVIEGYTPDTVTVDGTMGDEDMSGKTITVTYTANAYKVTYIVDGEELTAMDATFGQSVPVPRTPQKDGYKFAWVDDIPEKMPAENIIINGGFTPVEYTATFIADGKTVAEVQFTVETESITEPAVPEKEGYTGEWSKYTLGASDIEINAVYTEIPAEPATPDEPATETEPENDNLCPLDGTDHGTTFMGKIIKFFHSILWSLFRLVGLDVHIRLSWAD